MWLPRTLLLTNGPKQQHKFIGGLHTNKQTYIHGTPKDSYKRLCGCTLHGGVVHGVESRSLSLWLTKGKLCHQQLVCFFCINRNNNGKKM